MSYLVKLLHIIISSNSKNIRIVIVTSCWIPHIPKIIFACDFHGTGELHVKFCFPICQSTQCVNKCFVEKGVNSADLEMLQKLYSAD